MTQGLPCVQPRRWLPALRLYVRGGGGVLYHVNVKYDLKAEICFHTSGPASIDDLTGTGLDDISDRSARWSMPFFVGSHVRF